MLPHIHKSTLFEQQCLTHDIVYCIPLEMPRPKMRSLCLREPVRIVLPLLLLYALDVHGEKHTHRLLVCNIQFLGVFISYWTCSEAVTKLIVNAKSTESLAHGHASWPIAQNYAGHDSWAIGTMHGCMELIWRIVWPGTALCCCIKGQHIIQSTL